MTRDDDPTPAPLPENIGRYRVLGASGHGAMGRVLLARDPNLDRDVAVKVLREDLKLAPAERVALYERMRQEARASARLSHPNIVGLY
ncbi:MAG: serine/threonine protein kinase, partial [Sorangiineae bacterium PRO1]|nr:serine/threonine protein kinase [Sorangiineae bacterium PRO1]